MLVSHARIELAFNFTSMMSGGALVHLRTHLLISMWSSSSVYTAPVWLEKMLKGIVLYQEQQT